MNIKLKGEFVHHLEVELMPGEYFYAQKGALVYQDYGIRRELEMSGGRGLLGMLGAKISGESCLIVRLTNVDNFPRKLVVGSMASLVPVKMQCETIVCRSGAYVASNNKVEINSKLSISGLVGGMGMILQKITGTSTVFLDSIGQPIVRDLAYGENVEVDENHIVALQGITDAQMRSSWSMGNLFGGEGLSMMNITGPGRIYLSPGSMMPQR